MTRPAYIAAPFWHPDTRVREWHTRRAELLCRLAAAEGYEPVSVHRTLMDAGVDDDADPEERARGLDRTCATVREIAREGGAIYVLTDDAGITTSGTRREVKAWNAGPHVEGAQMRKGTWLGFHSAMGRAGLAAESLALRVRPC